jgi:hypothetical protein
MRRVRFGFPAGWKTREPHGMTTQVGAEIPHSCVGSRANCHKLDWRDRLNVFGCHKRAAARRTCGRCRRPGMGISLAFPSFIDV